VTGERSDTLYRPIRLLCDLLLPTDRYIVCRRFGFVVAVLTWFRIMCRRFGRRRFDRVPLGRPQLVS